MKVSILDVEKSHSDSVPASPLTRIPAPQPSSVALRLAEELIDHVSYGLTRGEHIREVATIIDGAYSDLVEAARVAAGEAAIGDTQLVRLREALRRFDGPTNVVDG
jgi:hypothetical protein